MRSSRPGTRSRTRARRVAEQSVGPGFLASLTDDERAVVEEAGPHTMTSPERLVAAMDAARHVAERQVPGAIVECGVWRGGSVMAIIRALQAAGAADRDLWLFDTFEGMTEPGGEDTSKFEAAATETWAESRAEGRRPWEWVFGPEAFNLESVENLLIATGYPLECIHFCVGPVESTLPHDAPEQIALLRLDTDWYASTRHELEHLYPRLVSGGVLIIDDYGHWDGARSAVDEYFAALDGPVPLLSRIDYTGRIGVKP